MAPRLGKNEDVKWPWVLNNHVMYFDTSEITPELMEATVAMLPSRFQDNRKYTAYTLNTIERVALRGVKVRNLMPPALRHQISRFCQHLVEHQQTISHPDAASPWRRGNMIILWQPTEVFKACQAATALSLVCEEDSVVQQTISIASSWCAGCTADDLNKIILCEISSRSHLSSSGGLRPGESFDM